MKLSSQPSYAKEHCVGSHALIQHRFFKCLLYIRHCTKTLNEINHNLWSPRGHNWCLLNHYPTVDLVQFT